jgi:hypothetical protein
VYYYDDAFVAVLLLLAALLLGCCWPMMVMNEPAFLFSLSSFTNNEIFCVGVFKLIFEKMADFSNPILKKCPIFQIQN